MKTILAGFLTDIHLKPANECSPPPQVNSMHMIVIYSTDSIIIAHKNQRQFGYNEENYNRNIYIFFFLI